MSVLQRCPSYRGVRLIEVSVKRESTVDKNALEKSLCCSENKPFSKNWSSSTPGHMHRLLIPYLIVVSLTTELEVQLI